VFDTYLILIVSLSTFLTVPNYEGISRLYQKHLQNAEGLVAVDGCSTIDQSVLHILSAEVGSMGDTVNRSPGSDHHDDLARQIRLCSARGHRPLCLDSYANLVRIQIGQYTGRHTFPTLDFNIDGYEYSFSFARYHRPNTLPARRSHPPVLKMGQGPKEYATQFNEIIIRENKLYNQSVDSTPKKTGTNEDYVFMLSIDDGRRGME